MKKIVFGPITSRRFGRSLGIDLSPKEKQCNFDCLYCELSGAKPVDFISDPPLVEDIVKEVSTALLKYKNIDVITLTANGEPTLYPHIRELIDRLNRLKRGSKLLILSNGATSTCKKTRDILKELDIVKFSLDCATQKCFKKIDRPIKGLHVESIIKGIIEFRKIYKKELILEILVVAGINDKTREFDMLQKALEHIKPDRVDIGTIDRPPAYDVKGVSIERLKELADRLKNLSVSIAYKKEYSQEKLDFDKNEIIEMLKRRPQSLDDVDISFTARSKKLLNTLLSEDIVYLKNIAGVVFYKKK